MDLRQTFSHRHPKYPDYRQYNIFSNQYVDSDYLLNIEDVVAPTVGTGPEFNHRFYFDFADYMGLTGTATVTGTVTHKAGGDINFKFSGGGTVDTFSISAGSGTQNFSATFPITGASLNSDPKGFLNVTMEAAGQIINVNGVDVRGSAEVTDLRCSIAVTGRTRINTSNVYVNTYTELDDIIDTGPNTLRDTALRFENWNRGSVIGGNPVVYAVVASFGVLDMIYPITSSSTEDPIGRMRIVRTGQNDEDVPAAPSLVIRKDNADVLASEADNTFGIGGSATELYGGPNHPGQQHDDALVDIPALSHFVALNDGNLSLADTTDVDIELRYIDPGDYLQPVDVRTDMRGYQDGFVQARLLLNPPFLAEDLETKGTFTISELYYIDNQFTTDFRGGIQQLGSSTPEANFTLQSANTGTGVIIDGGAVNTTVGFGIRDIYQLDTRFTANFVGNQRHRPTVDIDFNLAQSLIASETGIIIANEKTTTFNWELTVDSVVFVVPDRYRELLLPAQTRTYPVTEEKRDYAVNTQSRSYRVQQEQRQRTVDTQTRILKQKGYNT
jgi:hypothetical protein